MSDAIRGVALLLGSLLWEGDRDEDGAKGMRRRNWRMKSLDNSRRFTIHGLPLRYGRKSGSRDGQYTMVLRLYQKRGGGKAIAIPFNSTFDVDPSGQLTAKGRRRLRAQVEALARVEGIWTGTNKSHISVNDKDEEGASVAKPWGLVALWVNSATPGGRAVAQFWKEEFPFPRDKSRSFGLLLDSCGMLKRPWPETDLRGFDFCLCTPTRSNVRNWSLKRAAAAICKGEYFVRTRSCGIVTADDKRLEELLKREHDRANARAKLHRDQ